jgi:hypothetical protein
MWTIKDNGNDIKGHLTITSNSILEPALVLE